MSALESSVVIAAKLSPVVHEQALRNVLFYQSIIKQNPSQISLQTIKRTLQHHQSDPIIHPLDYAAASCIESQLDTLTLEQAQTILSRIETKLKSQEHQE